MTTAFATPCDAARNVAQLTGRRADGFGVIWGDDYLAESKSPSLGIKAELINGAGGVLF